MLQKPRKVSIPSFDIDKKLALLEKEAEPDLVQQYLQETVGNALKPMCIHFNEKL